MVARWAAAGGFSDNTLRLWDAGTGARLATLRGHASSMGGVFGVAWSPDGRQLASSGGDNTVRVWDVETGVALAILQGHNDEVYSVAWSPDGGRLASASQDGTARVWDAETGEVLTILEGDSAGYSSVAWSPDGGRLASASRDGTARVWDAETGEVLATLQGHNDEVYSVAWSPDGGWLASASRDGTVRVWDAETGEVLTILEGDSGWVSSVAWSPNGRWLASGSEDGTVRVWGCEPLTSNVAFVQPITNQITELPDWFQTPVEAVDGAWHGTNAGSAQVIVVNGIGGTPEGAEQLAIDASAEFGNVPVLGVYNLGGATLPLLQAELFGVELSDLSPADVAEAINDKLQAWTGSRLGLDNPAVLSLIAAIEATNNQAVVVGHSQGGAIAAAALRFMADNPDYDLTGLRVLTIGSASYQFPITDAHGNPITYEHRIHTNDVVPMVAGIAAADAGVLARCAPPAAGGGGFLIVSACSEEVTTLLMGNNLTSLLHFDPEYTTWQIREYEGDYNVHSHLAYFEDFDPIFSMAQPAPQSKF